MSSSKFVSNLDGMNEGENFSKDLLKVRLSLVVTCCYLCVAENDFNLFFLFFLFFLELVQFHQE